MIKWFFLFLIVGFNTYGQISVRGIVADEVTRKPIENVSVYYNNTKLGTTTTSNGAFLIYTKHPNQNLVFSSVGYETLVMTVPHQDSRYKIYLKPKIQSLKEVVIQSEKTVNRRAGWNKWGQLFFKCLMGDDSHAYPYSAIVNPEVLNFYYDDDTKILTVTSSGTIVIKHPRLGFLLRVDLQNFQYNLISETLAYESTLQYEDAFKRAQKESVQLATNRSYFGSKQHFLRALFDNSLEKEGFKIYSFTSIRNVEKQRVQAIINRLKLEARLKSNDKAYFDLTDFNLKEDTLIHYRNILKEADTLSRSIKEINASSIIFDETTNGLKSVKFKDTILVTYQLDPQKRFIHTKTVVQPTSKPVETIKLETLIFLLNEQKCLISENGYAINNILQMNGYMGSNRLAVILPADFDPLVPRW